MGQAFYRKYRSRRLDDVIGQEHITQTLQRALKQNNISHAYLFTGPRGVGKTSVARILAHEVNGLTYNDQQNHIDIIEIDAASNRRIDEIRELRERVHTAPAIAKYKVYIIDEVHMLTKEAFNALLKTLEEPPSHVIFILATTEAHKLPETIISRTQRFTFHPISEEDATKHLRYIAKQEKIQTTDEALRLIALHGSGSFRDSISLLDQVRGLDKITEEDVRQMLGIAPEAAINQLLQAVADNSPKAVVEQLEALRTQGYTAANIAKQLSIKLRHSLTEESSEAIRTRLLALLKGLINVPASHDPETLLEIVLLEGLHGNPPSANSEGTSLTTDQIKSAVKPTSQRGSAASDGSATSSKSAPEPPAAEQPAKPAAQIQTINQETWNKILLAIKEKHNTLYSILRMAKSTQAGNTVVLAFRFPFHQKRLSDNKNRQILIDIFSNVLKAPVNVECVLDADENPQPNTTDKSAANLSTISNIFGSAEMIE